MYSDFCFRRRDSGHSTEDEFHGIRGEAGQFLSESLSK